jgi:site-specific DNA recombinase
MNKAVIYVRVSSKEQQQGGYSIPAQLSALREYAKKKGFQVVKEYEEAETAKRVGRTNFQRMLDDVSNGLASVIIVEKTDRLTRNLRDQVTVDDLIHEKNIEVHLVKDGEVLSKRSSSTAIMAHGFRVQIAKFYIDNLSEEVKKGQKAKAQSGWNPYRPPYGYRGYNKQVVVVPEKAKFVFRLFELYASGKHSFKSIPQALRAEGYVFNPSQPTIPRSTVEYLLKNPFYRGVYLHEGQLYEGKHERIVPQHLLEQVDTMLGVRSHKQTAQEFLFQGLITCAHCGCAVVGELKKGRYEYWHCTAAKGNCKREYVPANVIQKRIEEVLASIRPTLQQSQWIRELLKDSREDELAFYEENMERLQKQLSKVNSTLEKVYDHLLEGLIDESTYRRKQDDLNEKKAVLLHEMEKHENANTNYKESALLVLELATNALYFYQSRNHEERRDILRIVLSNFTLKGREPLLELHPAFRFFTQNHPDLKMVGGTGLEPVTSTVLMRMKHKNISLFGLIDVHFKMVGHR